MAEIAYQVNEKTENIGARRLHTVMENCSKRFPSRPARGLDKVAVDAAYVNEKAWRRWRRRGLVPLRACVSGRADAPIACPLPPGHNRTR